MLSKTLTCFGVFTVRGAGLAGALRLRGREALHLGGASNHIHFLGCNKIIRTASGKAQPWGCS